MNFRLLKPWVFPKRAAKVSTFFNPAKLFAKISKKVQALVKLASRPVGISRFDRFLPSQE